MVESVSRETLARVFAPGVSLQLTRLERGGLRPRPAVVHAWQRTSYCELTLLLGPHDPLPQEGERARIEITRVDGLFQASGKLHLPELLAGEGERMARVVLRPDPATATRLQRRAFFRLPGSWPVWIEEAPSGAAGLADGRRHRALAVDLSAGGLLLGGTEGARIHPGARLRVWVDLGDGEPPLGAEIDVVREQASRRPEQASLWGCRFRELGYEGERRILRRLHTLYRERLRAAAPGTLAAAA